MSLISPKTEEPPRRRKVVVACDSFKGSLTAREASSAVADGVRAVLGDSVSAVCVPVADGGEGTVEMIAGALGGEIVTVEVADPLGRPVVANYAIVRLKGEDVPTAVIELAQASGLTRLSAEERNPLVTSTRGTGQLIVDAYSRGCRRFMIGLGGSATNDGGAGILQALGVRFIGEDGNELTDGGAALADLDWIDTSLMRSDIMRCRFTVLCDVDNPLVGSRGASVVFAPQKGASQADVARLDYALGRYGRCLRSLTGEDVASMPGAGAAGGAAVAFIAFFDSVLVPGITTALNMVGFDRIISDASLIITGEGHLDAQTLSGKAPFGVLEAGKGAGIPVIALAGGVDDAGALLDAGFSYVSSIVPSGMTHAEAMKKEAALCNLHNAAISATRRFFRL